jgi:probable F420-dependent oxidoreductase
MLSFGVTVLPDPPYTRLVELFRLAEESGFDIGWTYDSHVLWQEGFSLLSVAARETTRIKLGHCVANPGTREPTVVASGYATLHDISDGRMVCGIGRGDSARRVIGQQPVKVAEFEAACAMIRDLMNGRPVQWNDTEIQLKWVRPELPEIPLYVAGYGPKVLSIAGRVSDGVVIQLADPDIVEWTMGLARRAAEEAGRDPEALEPIVCAPCVVSDDLAAAREQVRWFPAMVSNHVFDLLSKYPKDELPAPLVRYVEQRQFYDYSEHSRLGAKHGAFVDDETCDRFCILGTADDHVAKLRRLEEIGVRHWNIYLMTEGQEQTLGVYGNEIIPKFDRVPA